jgi:hypothetical protein
MMTRITARLLQSNGGITQLFVSDTFDHQIGCGSAVQSGQWDSCPQRLNLHLASLPAHLPQLIRVHNLLHVFSQLARTSRRKPHSSLISPLKNTYRRTPEHGKKDQAPPTICADCYEHHEDNQADQEQYHTACQSFAAFTWADIRDACIAGVRATRGRFSIFLTGAWIQTNGTPED